MLRGRPAGSQDFRHATALSLCDVLRVKKLVYIKFSESVSLRNRGALHVIDSQKVGVDSSWEPIP